MKPNDFNDLLKIQRMMASKIMEETTVDSKIKLMDIIREMAGTKNKKLQVEEVIIEANIHGFQENETLQILEQLLTDKYITMPEEGYIKIM